METPKCFLSSLHLVGTVPVAGSGSESERGGQSMEGFGNPDPSPHQGAPALFHKAVNGDFQRNVPHGGYLSG